MTNENTSEYDICFGHLYNYRDHKVKCNSCTHIDKEECKRLSLGGKNKQ